MALQCSLRSLNINKYTNSHAFSCQCPCIEHRTATEKLAFTICKCISHCIIHRISFLPSLSRSTPKQRAIPNPICWRAVSEEIVMQAAVAIFSCDLRRNPGPAFLCAIVHSSVPDQANGLPWYYFIHSDGTETQKMLPASATHLATLLSCKYTTQLCSLQ